jgi:hypothetical protein
MMSYITQQSIMLVILSIPTLKNGNYWDLGKGAFLFGDHFGELLESL